jgi:hypothetical protein
MQRDNDIIFERSEHGILLVSLRPVAKELWKA